jgi:hypothetical protein
MNDLHQLDFLASLFSPLITTEQAAFILDDCSPRHVLDLVDEGKLRAISIASGDADRRELRIFSYSVHWLVREPVKPFPAVELDRIIPHSRPTLLRSELARLLSCSERHVSNLNLDGPRGQHDKRHRVYREAVLAWLAAAEVTVTV